MSLLHVLHQLTMGCMCGREAVAIDNRRFFVRSRLGEGGFSFIDLVADSHTGKLFALKRIDCHSQEDEKRALQEVEYMRSFDHPNIVPCEAFSSRPVSGYRSVLCEVMIVMPLYQKSLHDEAESLRQRGDHMPEARVLRLFRGTCEGLKALHTHEPTALAHRDIKPHNVMLEADSTPVLMDFGSMGPARVEIKGAAEARSMQDMAAERCSMPYRPPELFNVESYCTISDKTDIWSLGCLLHSMCYYESPFDKAYQRGDSIALAVLSGNTKLPETPAYSKGLKDLILSMLVINPEERPDIHQVIQRTESLQGHAENRI